MRFRSVLDHHPTYEPGRVAVAADGRARLLGANESPDQPLPSVVDAIGRAAWQINRYPDNACTDLTAAIAARHDVGTDQVVVGCGSVGLIQMLLTAVVEPGVEVVHAWRSFEMYPILTELAGATSIRIPLVAETHDLVGMAEAITRRTRMILVCNPNNPTGTVLHRTELEAFLEQVPRHCLVVLDEAYREYVRDPDSPDGVGLRRPNLAILRTFSKAYGLAGLRIGYLLAEATVAAQVRKTYLPYTVNHLAQVAALASLDADRELLDRVTATIRERARVADVLRSQGWAVPDSQANFVWLRLGSGTRAFTAACERGGVNVRAFDTEGVRITIGSPADNDAFLAVASEHRRSNGWVG